VSLPLRKIAGVCAALLFGAAFIVAFFARPVRDFWVDDTLFSKEIREAALRHGLPPQLVRAVVFQESRFDPRARGGKGEIGLMQILPAGAVAEWARVHKKALPSEDQLFQVPLNLEIGCWYLGRALKRWEKYGECLELALVQYNAGERRAKKWKPDTWKGKVIPRIKLRSTRRYVEQITTRYRNYIR
jgi:soluble lytic murein transglycosylase